MKKPALFHQNVAIASKIFYTSSYVMILDNCRAAGNITFQTKKRKFVKMKLWIGCDKKNLCIGDVSLQNGASPCINGQVIEKIEPGIWAKVLALSWIYIDLGPSNLHWSTCNCDLEAAVKDMASRRCEDICPHSHSRYLRNDMPHDSDFDCLLEIAKKMYHKPGHQDVCMDVVRLSRLRPTVCNLHPGSRHREGHGCHGRTGSFLWTSALFIHSIID
ncbi:hypothetical protein BSL78_22581 [Apostichopus japonicus]|uniref:Uncharacterized protein n=1 Tax=Stichopus japonicus TaxID=307972 RepID=A0A2G8JXX7_STIJA|nr:hypothetical protein BSL78_22581 [Apostichopus japonicus]